MNSVMGTPQLRCREMHQSGRLATMPSMRAWPQAGCQRTPRIASSAFSRRPPSSMATNHCGVARKMIGVLWRQQCG